MLGKEPTVILGAISEVVRQVIPMLVIFGYFAWTAEQLAQVMAVVSAVIAGITIVLQRSQVVPTVVADKQIEAAVESPIGTTVEEVKNKVEAQG